MPHTESSASGPESDIPVVRRAVDRRLERNPMGRFVRVTLILMAIGFLGIFAVAAWIHPYLPDGSPRTMASHTQLGMPECNMVTWTGKPCPSCGMTTSFSLLVHGDIGNSLKANWVGTLLAVFWMSLIPWGIASAIRGRLVKVRNGELFATFSVGVILTLMMARWLFVIVQ